MEIHCRHCRKGLLNLCFSLVYLFHACDPWLSGGQGAWKWHRARDESSRSPILFYFSCDCNRSVMFTCKHLQKVKILWTFWIRAEELTQHVATERTAPSGSLWGRCRCSRSSLRPTNHKPDTPADEKKCFFVYSEACKEKKGTHSSQMNILLTEEERTFKIIKKRKSLSVTSWN